ncbi:aldehyde dehydrogenase [Xanthobacter autotrophicus]|uniref:aldehyde dehydrogenase n=1 Tax=Xanthobacter autotrophicus TaxID=280 RepID=UPI00372989F7
MKIYKMFIDNAWEDAASGERIPSLEPWSEQVWASIPRGDTKDADRAVQAAHAALQSQPWAGISATARGALMRRLGDILTRDAGHLGRIEAQDNGKLLAEMQAQAAYLPQYFYYYGGLADKLEGTAPPVERPGFFTYTRHEPIGVVAALTPWNSPLLLAANKIAPALAAGCTIVLKPSEHASASALEFARAVEEAGFPPGVVNVVTGYGAEVGDALVRHPLVSRICFTGGEIAGRAINEAAARGFKYVDLELGGKSANIVFADADLEAAANGAIAGIFGASGQSCIAGSRLLVEDSIYERFIEKLVTMMASVKVGDPFDPHTQIGPITTKAQYDRVNDYICVGLAEGARRRLGGDNPFERGWFVPPTIFSEVTSEMRIAREEIFGPVLCVMRFRDTEDAIRIANDTLYGLAAGVWTRDLRRAFEVSNRLEAGTVWVNAYRALSYMVPFGGYKNSGLGRENGIDAIRNFVQVKSVWMNYAAPVANPFVMKI